MYIEEKEEFKNNFRNATLDGRDFSGLNLANACFYRASLFGADFSGANLEGADFRGADARFCKFSNANLSGANFQGAKLNAAFLDGTGFLEMRTDKWVIQVQSDSVRIGSFCFPLDAWVRFPPTRFEEMSIGYEWWKKYLDAICGMVEASKNALN